MINPDALRKFSSIVGPQRLKTSKEDLLTYAYDAYVQEFLPDAVLFPKSSEEVSQIMKVASAQKIPYHDPCHLLRSQGVKEEPRHLLRRIPGVQFVEMAGADVCCGGGGTFQWEHPDVASGITGKKVQSIKETGAGIVASGCPGCRLQISGNLGEDSIEILHPVELVARALP